MRFPRVRVLRVMVIHVGLEVVPPNCWPPVRLTVLMYAKLADNRNVATWAIVRAFVSASVLEILLVWALRFPNNRTSGFLEGNRALGNTRMTAKATWLLLGLGQSSIEITVLIELEVCITGAFFNEMLLFV
jgi:hypothetical protein